MSLMLRQARLIGVDAPLELRVEAGRISAIGTPGNPQPTSTAPETVDLDGRYVVPGFWDAHVHLLQQALIRRRLDVSHATSAAHALTLVAKRLHRDPPAPGQMLVGFGFRAPTWPDAPTTQALDAASGGHAVVLVSGDLHSAWFNTAAQARFGVRAGADGLVVEDAFFGIAGALDGGTQAERDAWIRDGAAAAAARGVVGVIDMEAEDPREWTRRLAPDRGERTGQARDAVVPFPIRVASAVWPQHLENVLGAGLGANSPLAPARDAAGRAMAWLGPLKVISDGSLNTRTAFCHDPYPGGAGEFGTLNVPPGELFPLMARAHAADLPCAIHAIGDAACGLALDAFAATGAAGSLEHAQLLTWADIPRLAALGITASVQPAHLLDDRDAAEALWPGRTDRVFPLAALEAAGVRLAFGSDAPVARLDPLLAIAAAVRRTGDDREPWRPEQRISALSALAASTGGAGVRPSVGAVADLVVLDGDPLRWAETGRPVDGAVGVSGTLLAGAWTHCVL